MSNFNWAKAAQTFSDFGGQDKVLHVPKTGLPFFDMMRLYGAIELYIGLQQEVYIHDVGNEWEVRARVREQRLKDTRSVAAALKKGRPRQREQWIAELAEGIAGGIWPTEVKIKIGSPLRTPDSALQSGIRNLAASSYRGLEARSTDPEANIEIAWSDALIAYAGQKRVDTIAEIYFLPVFEGKVDFSKVVSPLWAWIGFPNILCAQALTLLALKTSLFAEGYAERLSAVVYNRVRPKASDNYSGIVEIESTALGSRSNIRSDFVGHFYHTFRDLVRRAWPQNGRGKPDAGAVEDALAHAYWLMQPSRPKYLNALITSVERQKRGNKPCVIAGPYFKKSYVKEVFQMSHGKWSGNHEAVRKFARAVASAIWSARQEDFVRGVDDPNKLKGARQKAWKAWYDEVVMLRSAPNARAFKERSLILLEQGKQRNQFIGSSIAQTSEDFDPIALLESIGENRADYEKFRDLFRMYLIQESGPKKRTDTVISETETFGDATLSSDDSEEDQTGGLEE